MAKMSSSFMLFMSMMFLISSLSYGYRFRVGGKDGWAVKPSAGYAQWAHSLRFQINDSLYFRYDKAHDSVLVVNEKDYYSCYTKNPIKKFEGGNSIVNLDRSGSFYFVSGNVENCGKGEKLAVLVLSPRPDHKDHGPAKSPWFAPWLTPVHSPAPSWKAPSPNAPGSTAPSPGSTAPSPHSKGHAPSPGSKAHAPAPGPAPWKVPAPETPAPGWKAPTPSWTAPSPGSTSPAPSAPSPGSTSPAPSAPAPVSTAPAPTPDLTAPPPSAPALNASSPSQWNAPAPSPRSSGSSLSVSHGGIVAAALFFSSFVF